MGYLLKMSGKDGKSNAGNDPDEGNPDNAGFAQAPNHQDRPLSQGSLYPNPNVSTIQPPAYQPPQT